MQEYYFEISHFYGSWGYFVLSNLTTVYNFTLDFVESSHYSSPFFSQV